MSILLPACKAQDQPQTSTPTSTQDAGTSTDLFIMLGSDFVRPGLLPKANYDIGIGHTFGFLKKDPIGDEITFAYTYEDRVLAFRFRLAHGERWDHEEFRPAQDETS